MNVEISGVTRRFGRHLAVAGVDVETGPGVFGLLGPNGAGKTTLLRMMATVIPPSAGTLRLLGRDPGSYGPRRAPAAIHLSRWYAVPSLVGMTAIAALTIYGFRTALAGQPVFSMKAFERSVRGGTPSLAAARLRCFLRMKNGARSLGCEIFEVIQRATRRHPRLFEKRRIQQKRAPVHERMIRRFERLAGSPRRSVPCEQVRCYHLQVRLKVERITRAPFCCRESAARNFRRNATPSFRNIGLGFALPAGSGSAYVISNALAVTASRASRRSNSSKSRYSEA